MSLEHWETYYRGGGLVTCPTGPEPNYTREAREVWVEFFGELPDGARIVDVGTGNAPIPLIARETAEARGVSFDIHGVDLAQIDPVRHVPGGAKLFAGIRFHPGVAADRLPFETASVHAVTGQYAIEYFDAAASLGEAARVLLPGGRAQFVTHHRRSVVLANSEPTFRQFRVLFEDTRLLRRLRRFLELEREGRDGARSAARELEIAMRSVESLLAAGVGSQPVLAMAFDTARRVLAARRRTPASVLDAGIDRVEQELRGSLHRLQDLERAALDEVGADARVASAAAAGLECISRQELVHAGQHLIGWRLNFRKT